MTVAVPSTPASYFHLLRRHHLDGIRRPLVVFTPKSMLRNKAAVSNVEDFTTGKFRSVFEEPAYESGESARESVKRVLLVSGKLYWELLAKKHKDERDDIAIVRMEQLYPRAEASPQGDPGPLPECGSVPLGPGRARKPGCVAVPRAGSAGPSAGDLDRYQAHLASSDVRSLFGIEQGPRGGAAGDLGRGVPADQLISVI